jgi:hypothetical protein
MSKNKGLNVNIRAEDIKGTEIMSSGEYKYARVGAKVGDDEYVTVSYEWKGTGIPDFVMGLMEFIKGNKSEIKCDEVEFESIKDRMLQIKPQKEVVL